MTLNSLFNCEILSLSPSSRRGSVGRRLARLIDRANRRHETPVVSVFDRDDAIALSAIDPMPGVFEARRFAYVRAPSGAVKVTWTDGALRVNQNTESPATLDTSAGN